MLLVGLCLLAQFGCSGGIERVPVSGRVLIDGEPLTHGTIRVEPHDARMAAGTIEDGRFSLTTYEEGDGVPLGEHPVAINASEILGPETLKWYAPPKYAHTTSSSLTLNVEGPTDDVVFELTWDGGKPFVQQIKSEGE